MQRVRKESLMTPMQQDLPGIVERHSLDQHREALFLDNGGLVIQDDDGILVVLPASSAYHLLDLLNNHRKVLQLSQGHEQLYPMSRA